MNLAYTLSSLYYGWIYLSLYFLVYLKVNGIDPTKNPIENEI